VRLVDADRKGRDTLREGGAARYFAEHGVTVETLEEGGAE